MFNIFFLVFFALVVGMVLAVFVTRNSNPSKMAFLLPEEDAASDPKAPPLALADLQRLIEYYVHERQLTLKETVKESDNECYWIAEKKDALFTDSYIFGAIVTTAERPLVPLASVLEFKDFVRGARSTKGLLLSSGYFSRDVHQPLEGVKVQLLNRKQVLGELASRQSA